MSLGSFRQIRSAFHPETGLSAIGDKCHQLRFLAWKINMAAKKTYYIGPKLAFDEGGVATQSSFFCVRQHNKDSPIRNIDVDEKPKHLPTTTTAV
eukprot:10106073-Ditylum_brightwellii.AAC.1